MAEDDERQFWTRMAIIIGAMIACYQIGRRSRNG